MPAKHNPSNSSSTTLDVLIVGAGFAGICAAIKLLDQGVTNFLVLEKAAGIGGTWWHNTYPGAACDIASHLYCYSFEPNPDWSRKYSPQAEIKAYIEFCAEKYGVLDYIQLETRVEKFQFDEHAGLWQTTLADQSKLRSHHVIFASGGLHLPAYPDIPGREKFAGSSMHSAEWDHCVNFEGKRIAVIGSAASAIQLIPEIAPIASHIDVYQRTPNYISPRNDRAYTETEKKRFARWPILARLYRQFIFLRGEFILFPVVRSKKRSRWRSRLQRFLKGHIRAAVTDPSIREAMVPNFPLGCKRILIADNFFDAINRENVHLRSSSIRRIDNTGVETADGISRPADIIVYATGFDLENYMRQTEVTGRDGAKLSELWAEHPSAYKGGFVAGFPNFYFTTGPNTGVGTTSVVYMIEAQLNLILQAIARAGSQKLIEVTETAQSHYNIEIQAALQQTVWAGSCQSWYKGPDGQIASLYPYSARNYLRDHQQLEMTDFSISPVSS